jgi:nitric oxide dioxygenase
MITEPQILLVKNTWKIFRGIDPLLVADVFYSKLFTQNPELKPMFTRDMNAQYRKLIDMLSIIVARLDRLDLLTEDIIAMARRHAGYGVKPEHYEMVGDALIWTLKQGFGRDWSPPMEEAWLNCYRTLSDTMITASSGKPGK